MSVELQARLQVFLLFFCFTAVIWVLGSAAEERKWKKHGMEPGLSEDWLQPFWVVQIPLLFLVLLLLCAVFRPAQTLPLLQTGAQLLLGYALYSLLLLALTPLLRKRYSATSCALLWLLPCLNGAAALRFFSLGSNQLLPPLLTLRLSRTPAVAILAVWGLGALAVVIWKTLSHLRFRRRLLQAAVPASAAEQHLYQLVRYELVGHTTESWAYGPAPEADYVPARYREPLQYGGALRDPSLAVLQLGTPRSEATFVARDTVPAGIRKRGRRLPDAVAVLRSPAASAPLAIGLFRRTTRIVLPQRTYSEDELRLIFRHELCHLLRRDNGAKLLLTLQTALAWFLPTMWLGLHRAAEDAELACDELVTRRLPEAGRKQYAALLLDGAAEAKGYTTCLSASARGLRYRLRRVLHPEKRRRGGILAAFLLSLLLAGFSAVGFSVEVGTMQTAVFDRFPDATYQMYRPNTGVQPCRDPEALQAVLGEKSLYRDLSNNSLALDAYQGSILLGYDVNVALYENGVCVTCTDGRNRTTEEYYLFEEPFAWDEVAYLFAPDDSGQSHWKTGQAQGLSRFPIWISRTRSGR